MLVLNSLFRIKSKLNKNNQNRRFRMKKGTSAGFWARRNSVENYILGKISRESQKQLVNAEVDHVVGQADMSTNPGHRIIGRTSRKNYSAGDIRSWATGVTTPHHTSPFEIKRVVTTTTAGTGRKAQLAMA